MYVIGLGLDLYMYCTVHTVSCTICISLGKIIIIVLVIY